jgi:hypothetical protein
MKLINLLFILLSSPYFIFSQLNDFSKTIDGNKVVQFHGLVVEGDSLYGVPGASVFDPVSSRGATTGMLGYFSFPASEGDSIVVRAVGYHGRSLKIPSLMDSVTSYFIQVLLSRDTIILEEVVLNFMLPPEQAFKDAVLAYSSSSDRNLSNAQRNLNDQILAQLLNNSSMSASENYSYFMSQQVRYVENRYMANSIPFLDPFAWNRFFRDADREKRKKEEAERKKNNMKPY